MSRADQRSAARLAIVQALYQMDVTGKGLNEILAEFESFWIGREVEGDEYKPAEVQFFRDVLAGVLKEQRGVGTLIDRTQAEGWPL
jgi:N utilization substance protein B